MIKSFKDNRTKDVWERKKTKGLPNDILKLARRKLGFIEDAVTINDKWRICFLWHESDAYDVEIADYHG